MTNRLKVEYDLDQVWWKEFKENRPFVATFIIAPENQQTDY